MSRAVIKRAALDECGRGVRTPDDGHSDQSPGADWQNGSDSELLIHSMTSAPFGDRAKTEVIRRLSFYCPIRIL